MNDHEREQVDQIAETIRSSQKFETILSTYEFEGSPIGEVASDAVNNMISEQITSLDPNVLTELHDNEQYRIESIAKLSTLRESLTELQLSTDEIDQRLEEFNDLTNENDALVLNFIAAKGVAEVIGQAKEKIAAGASEAATQSEIFEDDAETTGRLIRLGYEKHADRPALTIGSRRIGLSGASGQQKDYSPERLAAVAVLADLLPGSELSVSALWTKINSKLGVPEDHGFDRDTMNHVRSFITNLRYRNQPIFYHNQIRGIASAYGVNPDLNYDVAFTADDDEVTAFIRELHANRKQPTVAPTIVTEEVSDIPATTMFVPEQVYQAEIPQPQLEAETSSTEMAETPELRLDDTIMPNPIELHVFLSKLHSSINILQGSLGTIDPTSMIARLAEITDETLEYYESGYTTEQKVYTATDAAIEDVRRTVTEKIIALTEDNELLNSLLEGDVDKRLEEVYGVRVGGQVMKLVETVLDMDEEEKTTLRKLIEARPGMSITIDEGSFSGGTQIIDVDFHLDGHEIEDLVASGSNALHIEEEPLQPVSIEEVVTTQLDDVSDFSQPANETIDNAFEESTVIRGEEGIQTVSQESTGSASKKLIRQQVGSVIEQLQSAGFSADSTFSIGQLESVFGLRTRDVVNARENNLIGENKGQSLGFEEVALILAANSNHAELKKVFQNNTKRKQFKKLLRQTIDRLR